MLSLENGEHPSLHSPADCAIQLLSRNREGRLGIVDKKAKKQQGGRRFGTGTNLFGCSLHR